MNKIADIGYGAQLADFYDRLFPGGPAVTQTVAFLAARHPGRGLPTLELGVGTGRVALPLADLIGRIVGVDSSPEMLAVLDAALTERPRPVTAVHGDIREYADRTRYGLIYCVCDTLSILLDPAEQQRVLDVAAAHLAPGGTVVTETHNPAFAQALHQGQPRIASELGRLTTAEEVDSYAEQAGLQLAGRYSDWLGTEFTGTEPMYVSVYHKRST